MRPLPTRASRLLESLLRARAAGTHLVVPPASWTPASGFLDPHGVSLQPRTCLPLRRRRGAVAVARYAECFPWFCARCRASQRRLSPLTGLKSNNRTWQPVWWARRGGPVAPFGRRRLIAASSPVIVLNNGYSMFTLAAGRPMQSVARESTRAAREAASLLERLNTHRCTLLRVSYIFGQSPRGSQMASAPRQRPRLRGAMARACNLLQGPTPLPKHRFGMSGKGICAPLGGQCSAGLNPHFLC